jgi:hypothetical protein
MGWFKLTRKQAEKLMHKFSTDNSQYRKKWIPLYHDLKEQYNDYDVNWEYSVDKQPNQKVKQLVDLILKETKKLQDVLKFKKVTISYVSNKDEKNNLARYISGTMDYPHFVLYSKSIAYWANKYKMNLGVAVELTLIHEFGHAYLEMCGINPIDHDENVVEEFAKTYCDFRNIKDSKKILDNFVSKMDNRQNLQEVSWTDTNYGGIPSGGGFDSNTEYEVGLQRILEAIHCILGSIERGVDVSGNIIWHELDHIKEEINIIKNSLEEYARPLYLTHGSSHYMKKTVENMKTIPQKMIPQIKSHQLSFEKLKEKINPLIFEMGMLSYKFALLVYIIAKKSVKTNTITQSVFNNPHIILTFESLKRTIEKIKPVK